MAAIVQLNVVDGVAVVSINNPPVNALSHPVRAGLVSAIGRAEADPAVSAIVLIGVGRTFPAGADIREFGQPPRDPWLPEVCNRIEACTKPVVAALHGTALGGGFEVALAAHYRLAVKGARIGLPEVALGILPGAGGTQRTPRLCGAAAALDLMLGGKPLAVEVAQGQGLIDGLVSGDLGSAAVSFAKSLVAQGKGPRPTRDASRGFADPVAYQAAIRDRRAALEGRPEIAPPEIVRCVEAAQLLPFDTGLEFERAAFESLVASDQSAALRHAFFAERRAAKLPELARGTPRDLTRIGIVGAGTMGAGIAVSALDAGLQVILTDSSDAALQGGLARLRGTYDRAVARGRLSEDDRAARLGRLTATAALEDLSGADLIVEAIVEDMAAKTALFARLDAIAGPDTMLATNTSYLDVNALAAATGRPGAVLGLHFFSPAHVMRLVEVVVADRTGADAVATGVALARRMGKVPVRAGVTDGFIGNRVLTAYRTAADFMLEDGATPYAIDAAMRAWGLPLGPYQVLDLAGLDISWARRRRLADSRDPAHRYVAIGDRMCEAGWLGQKAGRGYYRYDGPDGAPREDPEVIALIEQERARKGLIPRSFSGEEIQRRCLAAMVNEGARLLDEGIALRPSDIDVVMLFGYGFPRWRGGLMKAADLSGLFAIQQDLKRWTGEAPEFWTPHPLLAELIKNGRDFDSLNTG